MRPGCTRQVGRLVGVISETIPWWRVIRAERDARHLPRR